MKLLCKLGFHSWPRIHGEWRDIIVEPAAGRCGRCQTPILSLWRRVYPDDGSRCKRGTCTVHA